MNWWWVNHGQTRSLEVGGGYLWSPKKNTDGSYNQTYENMRLALPGDIVFSYAAKKIAAIGVVTHSVTELPKPFEFESQGENWAAIGWLVQVHFDELPSPVSPVVEIEK